MSERDRVERWLDTILAMAAVIGADEEAERITDSKATERLNALKAKILSNRSLAVVDREAKLPENPYPLPPKNEALVEWQGTAFDGYNRCLKDMAGWVKEVKDDILSCVPGLVIH